MAALTAQADSLAASMQTAALASEGVNPRGFNAATKAMRLQSQVMRDAAQSTGMWEAQQLKLNTAADVYNQKLAAQKLTLSDIRKQSKIAKAAYRDQLAMQQMVATSAGRIGGKEIYDVYKPTQIHRDLDTTAQRFGFLREQIRSASHQMVNWGKNTQWAGRQLMVGLTMPVAAFGAAAAVMAYRIEDELSRIQKVYDTTADQASKSAKEMAAVDRELAQLRVDSLDTATKAAREYASAAEETLNVQAELAATGLRGQRLQQQTNEVMRIATLGEIDNQVATKASISLQSVFRMSIEELTDSFNYMNAVENATSLQMADFAAAIPIAAAPVKAFGGDIKELGILLTAMKEQGIEAVQGANAIKATMQRLARPSKQIREEFEALTGANITEIVEGSENLTEIFSRINAVTKDMNLQDQRKVFAGLFGSYQVTRMMALTKGVGDLENGIGQVSAASKIASQDTTDWAESAEREIDRMMQAPSKQFKAALEELKIEMANFGAPFLIIGANIIKVITKILQGFDALPKGLKVVAALTLGLMALAGPVIMLVGLFANLAGNLGKFFVMITRTATKFELLNHESAASKIANELAETGFIDVGTAVRKLDMELDSLTQSYAVAARAAEASLQKMRAAAGLQPIVPAATSGIMTSGQTRNVRSMTTTGPWTMNLAAVQSGTDKVAKNSKAIEKSWGTTGKLMGVASIAMLASSVSSNETAGSISMMAMNAALAAGSLGMMGLKLPKFNREATAGATVISGLSKSAKSAGGFFVKILKIIPWIARALSPVGWAVAAITGGFLLIRDALGQAQEDQKKLNQSASAWSEHLGYSKTEWGDIGKITKGVAADMETIVEKAAELRAKNPEIVEAYLEASSPQVRQAFVESQYLTMRKTGATREEALEGINRLFLATGDSIETANEKLSAFRRNADELERLGKTASSLALVRKEIDQLGNSKWFQADASDMGPERFQYKRLWKDPKRLIDSIFRDEEEEAYKAGMGLAAKIEDGLSTLKNPFRRAKFLDDVAASLNARWRVLIKDIHEDTIKNLEDFGIDTSNADAMKGVIADAGTMGYSAFMEKYKADYNDFIRLRTIAKNDAKILLSHEKGITDALRNRVDAEGDAITIVGLQVDNAGQILGITRKQAEANYQNTLNYMKQVEVQRGRMTWEEDLTNEQKLQALNVERTKLGLAETSRLADGFGPATKKWASEQEKVNRVLRVAKLLVTDIDDKDIANFAKDAMSAFQQGIADATRSDFESSMSTALDRLDESHQARQETMERRHESAQRRLERDQEARRARIESSFDSRVDGIQKVIEAEARAEEIRKRIFDAEMQRLDRLNESANRNIDFNVALNAGDLDEAAKIRNDMEAQVSQWALSDAADRGGNRSARRRNRLEGQIEGIERTRDARLDAIDDIESREQRALDRTQERRKKALDAELKMEKDNAQKRWDTRKDYLEKSLDDFTDMVALNDRDLRAQIRRWNAEHEGLTLTTEGRFNDSFENIGRFLKDHMTNARKKMVNDKQWELSGTKIAKDMIRGAFGVGMNRFKKWLVTGDAKWLEPATPQQVTNRRVRRAQTSLDEANRVRRNAGMAEIRHGGGVVGSGGGSRRGYARTSGLHPNEVPLVAERGEFVVNKRAANTNRGILESINSGKNFDANPAGRRGMGGIGLGFSGLFGALMHGVMRSTIGAGINNAVRSRDASQASDISYAAARAGQYGDVAFTASQLRHAATIASVGKQMGMTSRDIMIGIMTAITESMLSLPTQAQSDRDSAGLFQQRPSQGWGSVAQVMDPVYASRKFFEHLKELGNRGSLDPWAAAQAVQRSAYADGSNYRQYWDEAQAIFDSLGEPRSSTGRGGWHLPITGKRVGNSHAPGAGSDIPVPKGTPVRSVFDGRVIASKDIYGNQSEGYSSYGRYIMMRHDLASGPHYSLYAHLDSRGVNIGQNLRGGSIIGRSGNTGNSSGPHLHFEIGPGLSSNTGAYPGTFLANRGLPALKEGAFTLSDGLAMLHRGETVLTQDLSRELREGIGRFANGGNNNYNVNVNVNNPNANADEIADKVISRIRRMEMRKPQSRRS